MNIQFSDLIENSPRTPGIYKMYGVDDTLLYVGKAKDINSRLQQYRDISKLELHKQIMRTLVSRIEWEITNSESDALILEEKLIKSEKPKYNIMMTDGKMYPMLALTNHPLPRLLKFRGKISQTSDVFGPYPSVGSLNETIKIIQKICQIRTCTDSFMKNRTRPCLLYQIGRCSGPCMIKSKKQLANSNYDNNVKLARKILTGDTKTVLDELSNEMKQYSNNLDFESAAKIRDKISALTDTAISRKKDTTNNVDWSSSVSDIENWLGIKIESGVVFDNSHLFGQNPVGAMIAFNSDGFIKSEYRHFKLKNMAAAGNDIAMMSEFITRAIAKHNPSLIIVDGGIAQWNTAAAAAPNIPVLGITKGQVRNGDEHFILPNGVVDESVAKDSRIFLTLRAVRDEAHRFAISYHRTLRAKKMTASVLDEIEGIGPNRKRALLNYFGSVVGIANADLKTLGKVSGLGKSAAEKIYSYFHK